MDPLLRSLAVKFMEINSLNQGGRHSVVFTLAGK